VQVIDKTRTNIAATMYSSIEDITMFIKDVFQDYSLNKTNFVQNNQCRKKNITGHKS